MEILPVLARENKKYDLIFYDPFSPRVAPELWSKTNVLSHFFSCLDDNGLFITYTASNKVRKGLEELGFMISPSVSVGRKMPGTITSKNQKPSQFFTEETLEKIRKSKSY